MVVCFWCILTDLGCALIIALLNPEWSQYSSCCLLRIGLYKQNMSFHTQLVAGLNKIKRAGIKPALLLFLAGTTRLELATSGVTGRHSNQN